MGMNMGEWLQQQAKWVWVWVGFVVAEMNMGTIWVWVYTVPRHSKRPFAPSLPMFKGAFLATISRTCACCCMAAITRYTSVAGAAGALHTPVLRGYSPRGESLSFRGGCLARQPENE
jgi:hypothetical protein